MVKRIIKVLLAIIAVGLLSFYFFYSQATAPMKRAKNEAVEMAEKYADLASLDKFYWFNREETYFSLTGKNKDNKEIAVIIPQTGERVIVLNQEDGLTEAQAREVIASYRPKQEITDITLGVYDNKNVWEVTTINKSNQINYYLLSFDDGTVIKSIENV